MHTHTSIHGIFSTLLLNLSNAPHLHLTHLKNTDPIFFFLTWLNTTTYRCYRHKSMYRKRTVRTVRYNIVYSVQSSSSLWWWQDCSYMCILYLLYSTCITHTVLSTVLVEKCYMIDIQYCIWIYYKRYSYST